MDDINNNNSNKSLEISRDFNVDKNTLYQAWINAEDLKQWWRPEDLTLEKVDNDVRTNGKILYLFKNKEGGEVRVAGEYTDVVPEEKLQYSWNWELPELNKANDGEFVLTILFINKEQGSRIEVKQERFLSDDAIATHKQAWEKSFSALTDFLSSKQTSTGNKNESENFSTGKPGTNNDSEKTGYNEIADQEKVGGYS